MLFVNTSGLIHGRASGRLDTCQVSKRTIALLPGLEVGLVFKERLSDDFNFFRQNSQLRRDINCVKTVVCMQHGTLPSLNYEL